MGEDGDVTRQTKYPEGYFYPGDVITSIENATSYEFTFDDPGLPKEEEYPFARKDSRLWECDMRFEGSDFIKVDRKDVLYE